MLFSFIMRLSKRITLGGKEDDPTILETLWSGHLIFSPGFSEDGTKITRMTVFKDIPTISTCQSMQLTKIPGLKKPDSVLEHLFPLLEQDMTRQVEGPADTIIWVNAPYLDMILLLNQDLINNFLPKHATVTNQHQVLDLMMITVWPLGALLLEVLFQKWCSVHLLFFLVSFFESFFLLQNREVRISFFIMSPKFNEDQHGCHTGPWFLGATNGRNPFPAVSNARRCWPVWDWRA